jgi:transposase
MASVAGLVIRLKEAGVRLSEVDARLTVGRASVYRVLSASADDGGDRLEVA